MSDPPDGAPASRRAAPPSPAAPAADAAATTLAVESADGPPRRAARPGGTGDGGLGPIPGFTRPPKGRPWYRRWAVWVAAAVVVVGVSIVADLPTPQNLHQQASTAAAVVKEIVTGLHPCEYAATQSFTIYRRYVHGTFPQADRSYVPQYLREDQQACSFENTAIFGMSTITVPNSAAGARLNAIIKTTLDWATSDANGAIVDIQTLVVHPTDEKALRNLAKREHALAGDRATAVNDLRAAERDLHGSALPSLELPALSAPTTSSS